MAHLNRMERLKDVYVGKGVAVLIVIGLVMLLGYMVVIQCV